MEPEVCDKLLIEGCESKLKVKPLLATLLTVTTTLPVVAPEGTGTVMLVALQTVGAAGVPLNEIVLAPCVVPNPVPVIVTDVATTPLVGEIVVMPGPGCTVKFIPAEAVPLAVTTTFPVVAPAGG